MRALSSDFIAFDLKYFEKKGVCTHSIFVKHVPFEEIPAFVVSKRLKSQ